MTNSKRQGLEFILRMNKKHVEVETKTAYGSDIAKYLNQGYRTTKIVEHFGCTYVTLIRDSDNAFIVWDCKHKIPFIEGDWKK